MCEATRPDAAFAHDRAEHLDGRKAFGEGDPDNAAVWFGEAAGLIGAVEPASVIVKRMAADAADFLASHAETSLA